MHELFRSIVKEVDGADIVEWGALPQNSGYPAIVLNIVSDTSDHTQSGPSGFSISRVQVDVYAETYGAARLLARKLRAALDGKRSGIIDSILRVSERDAKENGSDGQPAIYRVQQDFNAAYTFEI